MQFSARHELPDLKYNIRILEPFAESSKKSAEVVSSEDLLSHIDQINEKFKSMKHDCQMSGQKSSDLDDIILLGADAIAL